MRKLNYHIYPSYFTNESRILREVEALVSKNLFDEIVLIGFWKSGLPKREVLSSAIEIIRIDTHIGKSLNVKWLNLISFFVFYLKVLAIVLRNRPLLINAHSLTVLPLGTFSKWLVSCKLLYDPHELETETNDSKGIRKRMAQIVERFFIKSADYVIVVSNSIGEWYKTTYGIENIDVIKNISKISNDVPLDPILRETLNIREGEIIFIYSGVLSHGRGIEALLEVFKALPSVNLVFMGYGSFKEKVLEYSDTSPNIRLLEAVNPNDVTRYISGADVGISFIENTCLSYYYSLPNKVFEYLSSGIPFICSNFPDVKQEFQALDLSWFVSNEDDLKSVIGKITREQILAKTNNVINNRMRWNWNNESIKLIDIYSKIPLTSK